MVQSDDDDDDTYVTIGTPCDVPEENEPLKKAAKVGDQIVVDEKGRRRFHGAFTGGFSAGYYNTVGSKEGWTPSTFVSSRSKRNEGESTTLSIPEDFMDENDFADHGIAPRKLQTTSEFQAADVELQQRKRNVQKAVDDGDVRSAIPGGIPIDDLILPSKLSIGIKLLKKMGWKPGQGIGEKVDALSDQLDSTLTKKKVYGCPRPQETETMDMRTFTALLAPKDIQPFQFARKDNVHGIGYSGIDPKMAMFGGVEKNTTFRPTGVEKKGIKGQAFGVGVFEVEDDDIYGQDSLSNYDLTMGGEDTNTTYGWSGAAKKHIYKGCLTGFIKTLKPLALYKEAPVMITIPAEYIPKHHFADDKQGHQSKTDAKNSKLSSKERSLLLGETTKGLESVSRWTLKWDKEPEKESGTGKKTRFSSRWDKEVDSESSERAPDQSKQTTAKDSQAKVSASDATTFDVHTGAFKPFAKDPAKQARYEQFLSAKKATKKPKLVYDINVTEWEREREIEEFSRASVLYRPLSSSIATRFTRATEVTTDVDSNSNTHRKKRTEEQRDDKKAAAIGMFGKLTRTVLEWHPDRVLCKRFNIPPPFPNSKVKGVPGRGKKNSSFFNDSAFDQSMQAIEDSASKSNDKGQDETFKKRTTKFRSNIGPLSHLNPPTETENSNVKIKTENEQEGEATKPSPDRQKASDNDIIRPDKPKMEVTKPPFDMFKAIFDNSDSSDEEEWQNNLQSESKTDDENLKDSSKDNIVTHVEIEIARPIAIVQSMVTVVGDTMTSGNHVSIQSHTDGRGKSEKILPLSFLNNRNSDRNDGGSRSESDKVSVLTLDKKLSNIQATNVRAENSNDSTIPTIFSNKVANNYIEEIEWEEEDKSRKNKSKKNKKERKHKKEKKHKKKKKRMYLSNEEQSESEDESVKYKYKKPPKYKKRTRKRFSDSDSSSSDEKLVPSNIELFEKLKQFSKTKKRPSAADFM